MADTRILLAGLEEYHRVLGKHLAHLMGEFQQLSGSWQQFSAVYDGNAADQFREGWTRTSQRFAEYIEQTRKISELLGNRIEDLRDADRTIGA